MKRLIAYLLTAGILLLAGSCKKNRATYTDTQVRIYNNTQWTFTDCTIDPYGTFSLTPGPYSYNYGQVNINASSHYQAFPQIYKYAWVRLTMNNKTYYLHPFDYIGEVPLPYGRFTYKISYDGTADHLSLELITD